MAVIDEIVNDVQNCIVLSIQMKDKDGQAQTDQATEDKYYFSVHLWKHYTLVMLNLWEGKHQTYMGNLYLPHILVPAVFLLWLIEAC